VFSVFHLYFFFSFLLSSFFLLLFFYSFILLFFYSFILLFFYSFILYENQSQFIHTFSLPSPQFHPCESIHPSHSLTTIGTPLTLSITCNDLPLLSYWDSHIIIGKWYCFRNIIAKETKVGITRTLRLIFGTASKIENLSPSHPYITQMIENASHLSATNNLLVEEPLSHTNHSTQPLVSVSEMVRCSILPQCFRLWIKLTQFSPKHIHSTVCSLCHKTIKSQNKMTAKKKEIERKSTECEEVYEKTPPQHICECGGKEITKEIRLKLRICDKTAEADVLLAHLDAVYLFQTMAKGDVTSPKTIIRILTHLIATAGWFECCVKSYRTSKGRVRFRLFDTTLLSLPT
jgi:hypothetical protein